jgi:hypothetical protein
MLQLRTAWRETILRAHRLGIAMEPRMAEAYLNVLRSKVAEIPEFSF